VSAGYTYRTAWFLLMKKQLIHRTQRKLDSFFRPKVPRLERVEDDGNSGGNGRQRNHEEFFPHQSCTASNFVPLMFLQGPYFSAEGALGLPKAKSW